MATNPYRPRPGEKYTRESMRLASAWEEGFAAAPTAGPPWKVAYLERWTQFELSALLALQAARDCLARFDGYATSDKLRTWAERARWLAEQVQELKADVELNSRRVLQESISGPYVEGKL